MATGSISGRIIKQKQNPWGRWVLQEFTGKEGRKLVVVSAYETVDKRGSMGALTVKSQQTSLLLHTKDKTTNPRIAFCQDLLKELRLYTESGADLLVMGDFDETFGSESDGMMAHASSLQLVNLMASQHSARPPATYARGTSCLGYALASPTSVCTALLKSGYDAFDARLHSDHQGYFFDFQTDLLFGNPTQDLVTPQQRMLFATNVQQITNYINEKYDLLIAQNAFERGQRLTYLGDRHQFAERLDHAVLEASLAAESRIPQFGAPAWSLKLAQARKLVPMAEEIPICVAYRD
jgi:hypothetical protein